MLYFLTVIYCPWPPQHLWLLGAFFLMLQAARLNSGFLLLPLISCDCYCAWSQVTGGQRKEKKKERRLVHILPITAPLVKQNDSSPSLRTLAAAHHHRCHTTAYGRGWKEGKKKREPGDPPAPSLWQLGVSLFLGSETRNFTWRISLGALPISPWYTLLSFWLPLGPGCAKLEEKKMANSLLA